MKTIIQAKKYFTGDETTPKNIPGAFRLLAPLIYNKKGKVDKETRINATLTALEFFNSIGNNDEIAITARDVEFQQRQASSYTSEELDNYIKPSETSSECLLAIREKLRRIDKALEEINESDEKYVNLLKERETLQIKLAEPILGLFDQLLLCGIYNHITMAKICCNGRHPDYPNIRFEPQFKTGIDYLEEGVDKGDKNSILELAKIYLGLETTLVDVETNATGVVLPFGDPEKAKKIYQDAYEVIDEDNPENDSFFQQLEALYPPNTNSSEDNSDLSESEDILEYPTDDEVNHFLATTANAFAFAQKGHISNAKKFLLDIKDIYTKLARIDYDMVLPYLQVCEFITQLEQKKRSSSSSARHRNGFHAAPIKNPVVSIEKLNVNGCKQPFTSGKRIEGQQVCQYYIDIIFGETFFSVDVFNQFKEILSEMGFTNAKNIANKTEENPFHLRIWFDANDPKATETYTILCGYFSSALSEMDNGKGKGKTETP